MSKETRQPRPHGASGALTTHSLLPGFTQLLNGSKQGWRGDGSGRDTEPDGQKQWTC